MFSFLHKKIIFIFLIYSLFIIEGCGGSGTTARVFNQITTERDEIECPEISIIKNLDSYSKKNRDGELSYIVRFNSVSWECFIEFSDQPSLLETALNEENYSEDNFLITISMNLSFKISTGENITTDSIESFPYFIVLVDEKDNIIVKKKLDYSFKNISVMDTFILEEDKINIRIPNIDIDKKNARLLIGFINR